MKKINSLLLGVMLLVAACNTKTPVEPETTAIDYADTTYWYAFGDTDKPADVFYVYPTVSTISFADNDSSWFADITQAEVREEANGDQRFNKMLYDDYNFYAPYYRQMIFESYNQSDSILRENVAFAAQDVKDAFHYYMEHGNQGRPFFLVGHSQGSQVLIELLKNGMTDEQRQLMVAAYCIGYHVTAEELAQYPERLAPAADSLETGKLIVFNSATDTAALASVSRGDVVGVNPTVWSAIADTIPAEYQLGMAKYNEARDSVLIVPCVTKTYLFQHTTICPDLDPDMVFIPVYEHMFPHGNLHFADSWLFAGNVKQNMACRLRHFELK